jgi:hypothetical protein
VADTLNDAAHHGTCMTGSACCGLGLLTPQLHMLLLRSSPLPPAEPLISVVRAVILLLRAPTALGEERTPSWPSDAVCRWAGDISKLRKVTPASQCTASASPVLDLRIQSGRGAFPRLWKVMSMVCCQHYGDQLGDTNLRVTQCRASKHPHHVARRQR